MLDLTKLFIDINSHILIITAGVTEVIRRMMISYEIKDNTRSWAVPLSCMIVSMLTFSTEYALTSTFNIKWYIMQMIEAISFAVLISTTVAFTRPILFKKSMSKYLKETSTKEIKTDKQTIDNIKLDMAKDFAYQLAQTKSTDKLTINLKRKLQRLSKTIMEISAEMDYLRDNLSQQQYQETKTKIGITQILEDKLLHIKEVSDDISITKGDAHMIWLEKFITKKIPLTKQQQINEEYKQKTSKLTTNTNISKWIAEIENTFTSSDDYKQAWDKFKELKYKYQAEIQDQLKDEPQTLNFFNDWINALEKSLQT